LITTGRIYSSVLAAQDLTISERIGLISSATIAVIGGAGATEPW
jgi:hypothetical protein